METLSFAFGVLSAVGLLFVITIVLGAVKVLKQQKEIEFLNQWVNDFERNVWQALNRNEEEIHRQLNEKLNETTRYIDSRLDKLEQKLTGTSGAKQTLKG
jgi:predicted PurR-regulated permease PerM